MVSNPNTLLVESANIKQGRTEEHDYMQRAVNPAESAYTGVDGRNEVVANKLLGVFYRRAKGAGYKDGSDEAANLKNCLSESSIGVKMENSIRYMLGIQRRASGDLLLSWVGTDRSRESCYI